MTDADVNAQLEGLTLRATAPLAFRLQHAAIVEQHLHVEAAQVDRICRLTPGQPLPERFLRRAAGDDVIDHWLRVGLLARELTS